MQPEDIIRQKEWHLLTEAEKELLLSVTANREEYDLLRNMLLVAVEEKDEAPVIDPSVEAFLQTQLQKNKPGKRVAAFWYYAAASVVLVILSTWLLFKKPVDNNKVAVIPTIEKTTPADSFKRLVMPDAEIVQGKPVTESKTALKKTVPQKKTWRDINTSIAKDTMLLALVTEVY
jgi:hypothetical protein